jgi:HNH endonuclease
LPLNFPTENIEDPPLFSTQTEAIKAAADNGYRLPRGFTGGWLRFGSTTAPCDIFIAYTFTGEWLLSIEHNGVARELPESNLPGPGAKTIAARTLYELHQALDRTYRLSISLPTVPLVAFEHETADLPRTTEAERLVVMRVGQEIFRQALMDYWNGTCPLTGITDPALLRASHIVPWAECETDSLRLDVYNGILLSSLWDAAFDAGVISFSSSGTPIVSPALSRDAFHALRLNESPILRGITPSHDLMLMRHREKHLFT